LLPLPPSVADDEAAAGEDEAALTDVAAAAAVAVVGAAATALLDAAAAGLVFLSTDLSEAFLLIGFASSPSAVTLSVAATASAACCKMDAASGETPQTSMRFDSGKLLGKSMRIWTTWVWPPLAASINMVELS
jgi:hypothetical protein